MTEQPIQFTIVRTGDNGDGTFTDYIKIYVNGVSEEAKFATYDNNNNVIYAHDKAGRATEAKNMLDKSGNVIIDPNSHRPYIVPKNFSLQKNEDAIQGLIQNVSAVDFLDSFGIQQIFPSLGLMASIAKTTYLYSNIYSIFQAGGTQDLQRTYNEVINGDGNAFVRAFTPSASFNYSYAMAKAGFNTELTKFFGGVYNGSKAVWNSMQNIFRENDVHINTEGDYWNNIDNVDDLNLGATYANNTELKYIGKYDEESNSLAIRFNDVNEGIDTTVFNSSNSLINQTNPDGLSSELLGFLTTNNTKTKSFTQVNSEGEVKQKIAVGSDQSNFSSELDKVMKETGYDIASDLGVEVGEGVPLSQQSRKLLEEKVASGDVSKVEINKSGADKEIIITQSQLPDVTINGATVSVHNGKEVWTFKETATAIAGGISYAAGTVVEAGQIAYDGLAEFIKGNYQSNLLSQTMSSALNNTLADLAAIIASGGTIDGEKVLKRFATRVGYSYIAASFTQTTAMRELTVYLNGGQVVSIGGNSYMKVAGGGDISLNAATFTDANGNLFYKGTNSKGQQVTVSADKLELGGYGGALVSGLINFGVQAAFEGSNWNSSDYIKNGTVTVGTTLAQHAVAQQLTKSLGETGAAGAAAAATTIVSGLINNPNMNSSEYVQLGIQAGAAAGTTMAGIAIAQTYNLGSSISLFSGALAINPAALAIGAVLMVAFSSVMSKAYKGVQLGPTDAQSMNGAEDKLWRFVHLETTDADGQKKIVDAVMSFDANGATLNKQELMNRDVFRVFKKDDNYKTPTNYTKDSFNPTYFIGRGRTADGLGADNIVASDKSEVIIADTGHDYIDAKGGNNVIFGDSNQPQDPTKPNYDGSDVILSGKGNDIIYAGDGHDYVSVAGGDNMIFLGGGDDRLYTGDGNDIIIAGTGEDYIEAGNGNNTVTLGEPVLKDDGSIQSDKDARENEVYTGYGNDTITGSGGNDVIVSDWLTTEDANIDAATDAMMVTAAEAVNSSNFDRYFADTVSAGKGNDLVIAGLGNDTVHGNEGNDVIVGGGMPEDVKALAAGTAYKDYDILYGDAGNDIILGDTMTEQNYQSYYTQQEIEQLDLRASNDFIDGGIGNDYLDGGSGDDIITGGLGDDVVLGARGNDKLKGADGTDYLIGGAGNDTLEGGSGKADYYFFGKNDGSDTIIDGVGSDRLVFDENSFSELKFKRSGNDLVVTTLQGGKVTVKDHYNGKQVDWVYDKNNNVYSIGTQNVANGAFFTPVASTSQWSDISDSLEVRIQNFEGNYKDVTSPFAVNEASSWYENNYYTAHTTSLDNVQINGIQIGFTKRKRGWGGGHYNVFYQIKDKTLNGTEEQTVILDSNGTVNVDPESTRDGYDFFPVSADSDYLEQQGKKYWQTVYYKQDSTKVYEYEIKITDDFNDLLVGAYWSETINAYGGDDIVIAGVGNDTVSGGQGNDMVLGGAGDDKIYGDIMDGMRYFTIDYTATMLVDRELPQYEIGLKNDAYLIAITEVEKNIETMHDLLLGGTGDDEIWGQFGNDTLFGDAGDDTIDGGEGDDNIEGNAGNDKIEDLIGNAIIDGGSGNDTITTGGGFDLIKGGSGNDKVQSGAGNDTVFGNSGNDTLSSSSGADFIHGGDGNDIINGGGGNDILLGGTGGDELRGNTGHDSLLGGDGNDFLHGGTGKDLLDGGNGLDVATYIEAMSGVDVNMAGYRSTGTDEATGDILVNIENLHGSIYADKLRGDENGTIFDGDAGNDIIYGEKGNDSVYGGLGNDTLYAGEGTDYIDGEEGDDILYGNSGNNRLYGGIGNDKIYGGTDYDYITGGAGADYIVGGGGIDVVIYTDSTAGIQLYLNGVTAGVGGTAQGDVVKDVGNATGSNYNDLIYGNESNNKITGGALGNDKLYGYAGNDALYGYDGNDYLYGHEGSDILYAGNGTDYLDGGEGNDFLYAYTGIQSLIGGNGIDSVSYYYAAQYVSIDLVSKAYAGEAAGDTLTSIENLYGGNFNDILKGTDGVNYFMGYDGNDKLYGYGGNDTLRAGNGNDTLDGGEGNDFLYGGTGIQSFNGGNGMDGASYYYAAQFVSIDLLNKIYGGEAAGDTFTSIENIYGGSFNDTLKGNNEDNYLLGYDGNDKLYGYDGRDRIYGHNGDDKLYGDDGNDILYAGNGADYLEGGEGNDFLYGGTGIQIFNGGNGMDGASYYYAAQFVNIDLLAGIYGGEAAGDTFTSIENIYGGSFNDTLKGNNEDNYLLGYDGNDFIYGNEGSDKIYGHNGNDVLYAGNGADILDGGNDNDMLLAGAGNQSFNGGDGIDSVSYLYVTQSVTIDLTTNIYGGEALGDTILNIENLYGSNFDDMLTGDSNDNILYTYAGNDKAYGRAGNDKLYGYDGNDVLYGEEGDDFFYGGDSNDTLYGGEGKDTLYGESGDDVMVGGNGADILNGGAGNDRVDYRDSTVGIKIVLGSKAGYGGTAEGDILESIEYISATRYADMIYGDNNNNNFYGYDGNDFFYGDLGNDYMDGGADLDTVSYYYSDASVNINLRTKSFTGGYAQGDNLVSIENIRGSNNFADTLIGDDSANIIYGYGGNDIITGGLGADSLLGGTGNDKFRYTSLSDSTTSSQDTISDFETGIDKLELGFAVNMANVLIQSVSTYKTVSITGTSFSVQVNNNITLADIVAV